MLYATSVKISLLYFTDTEKCIHVKFQCAYQIHKLILKRNKAGCFYVSLFQKQLQKCHSQNSISLAERQAYGPKEANAESINKFCALTNSQMIFFTTASKRIVSSTTKTKKTEYLYAIEQRRMDPFVTSCVKINSKWPQNLRL